jgi:hypothetical protein
MGAESAGQDIDPSSRLPGLECPMSTGQTTAGFGLVAQEAVADQAYDSRITAHVCTSAGVPPGRLAPW